MTTKRLLPFICQSLIRNGLSRNSFLPSLTSNSMRSMTSTSYLLQDYTTTTRYISPSIINSFSISIRRRYSSDSTVSSNKLEVNGINFHYERTGTGDHAVILVPGALGCSKTDFQPQINGLSKEKYTIIAFDPRGYGKSRPPDRDWPLLHLERDAEDAAALMKKLDFPRYSILGWSDGGIIGLLLAGLYPGNVRKMLVWGANAFIDDKDMKMYKAVSNIDDWSERMRAPFIEVYGEEYFRSQWGKWINSVYRVYKERNGDLCVGSLPNIRCKTLIVNGLKDAMVPQIHPIFLQKHIPNCRTVDWPEGKHNLHLKYHQEFNKLSEEFLDEPE